jgi:branched-chain amino acid transport system permease protein
MADALQLLLAGVSIGAVYGLVAMGFAAVYSVSQVINLTQGEFAAIAGLTAISATGAGLPLPVAVLLAVGVVVAVALAVQRLAIAPVRRLTTLVSIILTLGVSTALKAGMLLIWGPEGRGLQPFPGKDFVVAGVAVRAQYPWILGSTALAAVVVWWFYERTLTGKALRACAEQPTAARLVGISVGRASLLSFGIAGLLGALAGVLASPVYFSSWDSGLSLGLKGFVAATLAGLTSVRGAIAGGIVLGVLESFVAGYVDSGLRDAVAFVVLILVLVVRPEGALGNRSAARV